MSAVAALILAGCGSTTAEDDPGAEASASPTTSESASDPTETVAPMKGRTYELDGLTITVPKSWTDVGERGTPDVVLSVVNTSMDDVPQRLSIARIDGGEGGVTAQDQQDALAEMGAKKIQEQEPVEIDGVEALYTTAVRNEGGVNQRFHSYVIDGEDATWVLTFSVNRWQQRPDPDEQIQAILASVAVGG